MASNPIHVGLDAVIEQAPPTMRAWLRGLPTDIYHIETAQRAVPVRGCVVMIVVNHGEYEREFYAWELYDDK